MKIQKFIYALITLICAAAASLMISANALPVQTDGPDGAGQQTEAAVTDAATKPADPTKPADSTEPADSVEPVDSVPADTNSTQPSAGIPDAETLKETTGREPSSAPQAESTTGETETESTESASAEKIPMADILISTKEAYAYKDVKSEGKGDGSGSMTLTALYVAKPLIKGTDYVIVLPDDLKPDGKVSITIRGKGDYSGSVKKTITVKKGSISEDCSVQVGKTVYTGKAVMPSISVTDSGRVLASGKDYTYQVSGNVNAGTGTVTISGKGAYAGSVTKTFTISPAAITNAQILVSDAVYTGSALTPAPRVSVSGKTLTANRDYTVSYSQNVNAGTAVISIVGRGNYAGTVRETFRILRASLSGFQVTLEETEYAYTGKWYHPNVTVRRGNTVLTNGTDYSVSYQNNRDPGTASVIITGRGNYTGTVIRQFTIAEGE